MTAATAALNHSPAEWAAHGPVVSRSVAASSRGSGTQTPPRVSERMRQAIRLRFASACSRVILTRLRGVAPLRLSRTSRLPLVRCLLAAMIVRRPCVAAARPVVIRAVQGPFGGEQRGVQERGPAPRARQLDLDFDVTYVVVDCLRRCAKRRPDLVQCLSLATQAARLRD